MLYSSPVLAASNFEKNTFKLAVEAGDFGMGGV